MNVYLSGGMEYADGEGVQWRKQMQAWIEANLHHTVFNPNVESERFFDRHYPDTDIRKLKLENISLYAEIIRNLVDIDCNEIAHRSDYLICYWDESAARGAGTKGELTMAKYFNKPVYLVTSDPLHSLPGWVLGCITKNFASFEDLKSFLLQR